MRLEGGKRKKREKGRAERGGKEIYVRGKVEITCVRSIQLHVLYFNIAAKVYMEETRLQTQHTVYTKLT